MRPSLKLSRRKAIYLSLGGVGFALASCTSPEPTPAPTTPAASGTSKPTASASAPATSAQIAGGKSISLSGAGASFPAPLYQRWFSEFNKKYSNVQIGYQSVGSGAGVKQFIAGTVDFGASDTAMKDDEIAKVTKGAVLLPVAAGSIVIAYNLPDVKEVKLSREVYSNIFLGKITKWNDPAIVKLNDGVKLPDTAISVVSRSDGSGTTGVFTKHLSAVSAEWKSGPGEGKSVQWPTGTGAKGNEGVAAAIQQTAGAIGYIEYGYAVQNKISFATIENKSGKYIKADPESGSKSLAVIELPANLIAFEPDPKGDGAYPIVSYTWLLLYKKYDDPNKAEAIKAMLDWALTEGQKLSGELGYIPLPAEVVTKLKPAIATIS
ncbi:phosphate ABC transporter substrate-binding protein PstS [Pseudanabaena sp. 'Roaring Creek']|uniref:phosphate ABC transporter substrate-binding protein PstS n=1 Tax=Pseudanabaena sp. 'Roaring Creek' TaxID=1681830 RepID=UPI0006D764B5|nr:phosphate ABC transporter substrate-binding protein PstS [Pseudanabaena sp. 'Roaring Creek']